ncbi:glycine-rich protein [Streptomyces sp. NPDC004539]|uniref:DUF7927 domain-containing protein n=1 Tax=Streptomyces sp. NPDC004539 TaxID=3154280 RepID=UPI0033BBFAE2
MYEKTTRWPGRTLAALVVLFLAIGTAPALGEPTGLRDALGNGGARLLAEWPSGGGALGEGLSDSGGAGYRVEFSPGGGAADGGSTRELGGGSAEGRTGTTSAPGELAVSGESAVSETPSTPSTPSTSAAPATPETSPEPPSDPKAPAPRPRWHTVDLDEEVAGRDGARGLWLPAAPDGHPYTVTLTLPQARPAWVSVLGDGADAVFADGARRDNRFDRRARGADLVFAHPVRTIELTVTEGAPEGLILAGPFGSEKPEAPETKGPETKAPQTKAPQVKKPQPQNPATRNPAPRIPHPTNATPRRASTCTPSAGFTNCTLFSYTGADQTFSVPAGVSSLNLQLWGAGGGGDNAAYYTGQVGGAGGGYTTGTLAVTSGQSLMVMTGQGGNVNSTSGTYGGGGSGGNSATLNAIGASGGGMSALWTGASFSTPLLIAGGGGGASPGADTNNPRPGAGGGTSGGSDGVTALSGQGGTQSAGGAAGTNGSQCEATSNTAGRQWYGGNGFNVQSGRAGEGGGGGGGGYYGGGGGACQPMNPRLQPNGPGGGGSGYTGGPGITSASTTAGSSPTANNQGGAAAGTGSAQYPSGVGVGGADSKSGGNGAVVIQWVTQTKLSVTKTASPNPYVPGSRVTYTVTVSNAGPAPAPSATITDTVPAGLTGTTWNCAAGTGSSCGTASGTGNSLNTTATIAANSTVTYTITGTTSPSATATLSNTATVTPPSGVNDTTCGSSCSATSTTPANPQADLTATKTASTANVSPGQTYTYTLTTTNNGPSTATNVRMTDTLPNNVSFQSGSGCTASGQSVTCGTIASLAPAATQSWTITVKLASSYKGTGSDIGNTATAAADTTDPNTANNTATSGPPPIVAQSDYDVTPSGPGGTVAPGQPTTIPVVVRNNGPADASGNVTVTVTLPAGVTASGNQPSGCTANSAGTVVTCTIATLTSGSSLNLPISVLVASSAAPNSTLTRTGGIVVTGPNDNVAANNTADAVVRTSGAVSDLAVTKTAAPTNVNYGENTVFTVTVTNNGPSDAANVQVTDQLPSGLTYVSDDSNGAYSGGVWKPGTIGAGKSATLRITAKVSSTTAQTNTVTQATSDSTDPTPCTTANPGNCASATVTPIAADLATTKTATGTAATSPGIAPGETFSYDIKVTNNGPSAASSVVVTDTLPSQLTFVSSSSGCTASGQNVTCPQIASLANGASQTFTVTVRLASTYTGTGSDVANTAGSTSSTPDQTPGNNTSPPASPQVTAPKTGLTVSKTGSSTSYQPGETFSYTVTVRNAGPSTALPTVTDTLPAGFSSFGWNCAASNGSSCGSGSGSGNISDKPSVAPGGTITYTISGTVPATTSGNQTNSATVTPGTGTTDAGCSPSCTSSVVTNGPNVQIAKTSSPTLAKAGQTVTYTITLRNSGSGDADAFTYTDDLSDVVDDATFVAGSITSNPAGGTGSYDSGTKKLTWTGAVAAGATVRVTYQVTVGNPPAGNQVLKNVVSAPGTNCATGSTDSACSDDNGGGIPRLTISKASDAGGTVHPGQKVTYTVTVHNPGTATYTGATWTDDLTDVVDDATYGADASATSGSTKYTAPKLTWSGNLAAGATATITYSATVNTPDTGDNRLVNRITSSTDADCSTCTTTNGVAGLRITKSASEANPKPGTVVTYTVTATNTGSVTYTGASWTDDLTDVVDDAAYGADASATSGDVKYAAPKLTWSGDLAAGGSATTTYSVTVANPDIGNKKLVNSVTGPPGTNCVTCTTTSSVPQLKLTKTSSPANPAAGQTVTYTVVAENTGAAAYPGATWSDDLTDLIDDGTYADDASASAGTVKYAAPKLTWSGDLDPGDKATTTYSVKLANPLSGNKKLVNKVVSTTDTNCAAGSTSSDCGDQNPVTVRELTMKKTSSNTAPKPGDKITYTVTVENTGTAAYTGAAWSDDLVNVLDDGTYGGDASATSGTVKYAAPKLSWSGDLAVGASATVTYSVTLADPDDGDRVIKNTLVSSSDGANCPADGTDPACTAGPYGIPSLTLSKTVAPANPLPGDTLTYTIKLVNDTATDYPGATFSDDLTGVLDEGTWANLTTASAGSVTYTEPTVKWTGTVPAGTTQTVTYQLKLNDPRTGDGKMVNTVVGPAGSNCKQGSTDNRCSSDVGGLPELHITKSVEPVNPVAGEKATYTVVVENTGNAAYNGATWSDNLSEVLDDAVYGGDATASAGEVSYTAPTLKWSGDLAAGASARVTYSVTVNTPISGDGKLTNSVVGPQGSNCATGSTDADCTASSGIGMLKVTKTYTPEVATPGSVITYTVAVENTGTGTYPAASGFDDLTGVLDDAVYNDDAEANGGTLKYEAPKLSWNGDLAAGVTGVVTYSVTVKDPDTGDKKLANAVTGPKGSNCAPGSTDKACAPTPAGVPTLSITKSASTNRPTPGSKVTYTVTVENTGTAAYKGAAWSDDLTDVVDDAVYGGDGAASAGEVSYTAPTLKWSGDLAAGASATVTYSVTVKSPLAGNGKLANSVTGPAGSNCQSGKQGSECSTGDKTGDGIPQLTLTKTSTPANPVPGSVVTYTVVAKNTGTAVYSAASWSDDLTGVLDDAVYGGDASTTAGDVKYAAPKLTWSGDLAPDASATTTYSVTVNAPDTGDLTLKNAVTGPNGTECRACSTSSGVGVLKLSKTYTPDTATPGSTLTYTVTVENTGTGTYPGASWSDDLTGVLDDATYADDASASAGSVSYTAPKLTWSGDLAAGASATTTYTVTVHDPDTGDKQLGNAVVGPNGSNCAAGSTDPACKPTPAGVPTLKLTKTASENRPTPGSKVTYKVVVENTGTAAYKGAVWSDDLTDVVDDAVYANDASATAGSVSYMAPTLKWSGDLASGASATVTYSVTVKSPLSGNGKLTNAVTGPAGSNCQSGSKAPECSTGDRTGDGIPQLTLKKTVSEANPKPGSVVTYTVVAKNTGTAVYSGASWSDDLTGVLDDAVYGGDASTTAGGVKYAAPKLTWSGDLAPDASATTTYSVTVNTPDTGDKKLTNSVTGPAGSVCEVCTTSSAVPQLKLTKTFTPANPAAGQTVTYTVVAENTGAAAYQDATWSDDLTDLIDDGTYADDASASAGAVKYAAPTLTWSGDLAPGDKAATTYSVKLANPLSGNKKLVNKVVSTTDTNCPAGTSSPDCGDQNPVTVRELTMKKTASNTAPKPGDKVTYTVTVENTGTAAYTGAAWSDDLTGVLDDATYGDDASASSGSVKYTDPTLTWSGDLAPGAKATITYSVTLKDPDTGDQTLKNTLVSSSDGANCPSGATDPACTAGPYGIPSLTLVKTVSPGSPLPGDTVTYTVTVENTGKADYPGATLSDDLSDVLDSATWLGRTTATTGSVTYTAPKLSWTGTVKAGATETLTYALKLNNPKSGDDRLVNSLVGPAGSNCKKGSTDNRCSAAIDGLPELHLTKKASPTQPVAGGRTTYTVTVQNTGSATYKDAVWTDDLTGALDDAVYANDASATAGSVSYTAPTLKWSGDLDAGASATVTYSVTLNSPRSGDGKLSNALTGPQGSNCESGSTDADCSTSSGVGFLKIAKTYRPQVAVPGGKMTYTVTVENTGTGTYPGASWSDDLTGVLDDATYDDASATTGSVTYTEPTVKWTGDLASGASASVTYTVTLKDPDTGDQRLTNAVVGPTGSNCAVGSTDSACAPAPAGIPSLEISKSASANRPTPGTKVTYTVTATNTGTAAYADATWSDDLTGVLDDAAYGADASATSGAVNYSSPKVTWRGDLAAGASATVTYSVTVDTPDTGDGRLTNAVTGPPGSNCRPGKLSSSCTTGDKTGDGIPQLSLTKTSSPANPVPGTKVTYTVVAENTGTAVYEKAFWTDDLTDVVDDAAYGDDATASLGTVDYAAPKLTWTGDIPAGASSTVTYTATVKNPDTGNKTLANSVVGPDGSNCAQGKQGSACKTSTGSPQLTLAKTYTPSNPLPGQKVTYTITARNTGTATYKDAVWTDDLTGILDDAVYGADATASLGGVTYTEPTLKWTGDVPTGQTATVTYTATLKDPATGDKELSNAVTGTPDATCADGTPGHVCPTKPAGIPALAITKTASSSAPVPGQKVTYTVTVQNTGKATYPDAVVTDDLTDALDDAAYGNDAAATAGDVNFTSPKLTWTGDIAPGSSVTLTYSVTVDNPVTGDGKLANSVTGPAGSNCQRGKQSSDCSTGDKPGNGIPQLKLKKAVSSGTAAPGSKVTYTITAQNTGTAAYTGATWSDDLRGVLTDAVYGDDANASSGTVSYAAPVLSWKGDIPAGSSATVTYTVTLNSPTTSTTSLTNKVTSTPDTNCPTGTANTDCSATLGVPQFSLTKTASTNRPLPGQDVTYTVTAQNTGSVEYEGATWTDDLTGVLDDAVYGDDANATTGKVSYDSPRLTWTGDIPVGSSATVTYTVKVKSDPAGLGDGVLTNAITSASPGNNCTTSSHAGCSTNSTPIPTLKFTKSQVTPAALPGSKVEYKVTVENPTTSDYPGASWTDDLSGVLDDADYNNDAVADGGSVSFESPLLKWSGDVAGGQTVTVTYSVTVDAVDRGDGKLTNAVVSGVPGTNCPSGSADSGCTTGSGTSTVVPRLKIVKRAFATNPRPGDDLAYEVVVTNDSGADYPGATFSDQVVEGAGLLNAARVAGPAASSGVVTIGGGTRFTWKGDVRAGESVTVTYTYRANAVPGQGSRRIVNEVTDASANSTCYGNVVGGAYPEGCGSSVDGPEYEFGEAPDTYGTTLKADGPYHVIVPKLWLGKGSYADTDGRPLGARLGEGGRGPRSLPVANSGAAGYSTTVDLTNGTGRTAVLAAWLDADFNGRFDQGERIERRIPSGTSSTELSWTGVKFARAGTTYLRLRLFGDQPAVGHDPNLPRGETLVRIGGTLRAVPADPRPNGYGGEGQVEDFAVKVDAGKLNVRITSDNSHPRPGDKVTYTVTVCSATGVPYVGATAAVDLSQVLRYASYNRDASAANGAVKYGSSRVTWTGTAPGDCSHPVRITFSVTYGRHHVPPGTVVDVPVVGGPGASNCPAGSVAAECNASAVIKGHGELPDTGGGRGMSPLWGLAAIASLTSGFLICLVMWMRRRRGWKGAR